MRTSAKGVARTGCSWRTAQWRRLLQMAGGAISARRVPLTALLMTVAGSMSGDIDQLAPQHPQDNWLEFIGAGVAGGFASSVGTDVYNDVKAVCRIPLEKYRDRQSDPDEEGEYMHQLVAEAFIGPCPPGHKLVHMNGDGLDNRRANLAYVPKSDPRPAAPLNPRPPGWPTKTAALEPRQRVGGHARPTGKKRRKGKRKRLQLPMVTTIIAIYGTVLLVSTSHGGSKSKI